MLLKDISFQSPGENILFDEALLSLAEQGRGGEVARFWESPSYFVVLGKISNEREDLKIHSLVEDRVPVLRRASGGGTVLQGPGCLNYALVLSKERCPEIEQITKSYKWVLSKVTEALGQLGAKAKYLPISDIALLPGRRKISGNAQKRGKRFILHHGTLLYDFQISLIERYLHVPRQVPDYREGRTHREFMENLNFKPQAIKQQLCRSFQVTNAESTINKDERNCLEQLSRTRTVNVELRV